MLQYCSLCEAAGWALRGCAGLWSNAVCLSWSGAELLSLQDNSPCTHLNQGNTLCLVGCLSLPRAWHPALGCAPTAPTAPSAPAHLYWATAEFHAFPSIFLYKSLTMEKWMQIYWKSVQQILQDSQYWGSSCPR